MIWQFLQGFLLRSQKLHFLTEDIVLAVLPNTPGSQSVFDDARFSKLLDFRVSSFEV